MARYHVNPETGRPNLCHAEDGNCPYKNDDGSPAPHFNTKTEARAYNEKEMNKQYGATNSLSKNKNPIKEIKDATIPVNLSNVPSDYKAAAQKSYKKKYNKNLKVSEIRKTKKNPVNYYFFTRSNGKEEYVIVPSVDFSLKNLQIKSKELSETFKETHLRPPTKRKTSLVSFEKTPKDFILAARTAYQKEFNKPLKGFYQIVKTKGWKPNYYFLVDNPETNNKSYIYVPHT